MKVLIESLLPWGPVFFGGLIFAPVVAALLDRAELTITAGIPSLYIALPLGLAWGLVAKTRGQWL
jgi:hypothetical protein